MKQTEDTENLIDIGYKTFVLDSHPEFYFKELKKIEENRDYIEEILGLWKIFKSYIDKQGSLQNISRKYIDYILLSTYNLFYNWAYEFQDNRYFGFSKFKEIIFYKKHLIKNLETTYSNLESDNNLIKTYWNSLICNSLGNIFSNILNDEGQIFSDTAQNYYFKSLELQNNVFAVEGLGDNFYHLSESSLENKEFFSGKGVEYYTFFKNNFEESSKNLPKKLNIDEIEYLSFFNTETLLFENYGEKLKAEKNYKTVINIIESKIDIKGIYDSYPYYNFSFMSDNIEIIQKGINILENSTGIDMSKGYVPYLCLKLYIPAINDFKDYFYKIAEIEIKKSKRKDLEEITKNLRKLNEKNLEEQLSNEIKLDILLLESEFYIKHKKWNNAEEKLKKALDISDSEQDKIYIYKMLIEIALNTDIDKAEAYTKEALKLNLNGQESIRNIVEVLSLKILSTSYTEKPIKILKNNWTYYLILLLITIMVYCDRVFYLHCSNIICLGIPQNIKIIFAITLSILALIPFIDILPIKKLKFGGAEIELSERKTRKIQE